MASFTAVCTGYLVSLALVLSQTFLAEAQNRIIGGYETTIEEFPFQLGLEGGGRHICGASILSSSWALTAAHCVYDKPPKWLALRSGSSMRQVGGSVHPVEYYIYHDNYRKSTLDYDVAVVKVKVPFKIRPTSLPVQLPMRPAVAKDLVYVTGWGYLENQQLKKPKQMMMADIYIWNWDECKKLYPDWLTDRMLCAGDAMKDICNGDSGGPMVRGSMEQVGISSWNFQCGDGQPSVYTNISVVAPWIRKRIDGGYSFSHNVYSTRISFGSCVRCSCWPLFWGPQTSCLSSKHRNHC